MPFEASQGPLHSKLYDLNLFKTHLLHARRFFAGSWFPTLRDQ